VGTLRPWVSDGKEKAMKTLSVLVIAAALFASGASAQGVYERGSVPPLDLAAADRSAGAHTGQGRIARQRGMSSYANVPETRTRGGSSAFDGDWSVLIQTRVGDCEPSFRYGVQIQNGEVLNAGGQQIALEGHVARNGAVRVSVAAGDQAAYGAGRLTQTSGGGTWRGHGARGTCAGTWVAERRG
jgi:hypothetical protein